jgi:hypothetical protein
MGSDIQPLSGAACRVRRGLILALLSSLALSTARPVFAAERHYPYDGLGGPVDAEGNCYNCHTLDKAEGVTNTSYIQGSARTMSAILSKNAGVAPDHLGCTFCHSSIASATMMKEVFSHFGTKVSSHPLGRRFDNGVNTDGEYFSTIDLNPANNAYELDCVDCHDPALLAPDIAVGPDFPYVGHIAKTDALRVNNLKMLKGGVAAAGAYDDLCRLCHAAGQMDPVASHADGSNLNPIVEDDATRLQTTPAVNPQNDKTQCAKCHDSHYSGKVRLFNDGHELDTPIDGDNCTAVCHFPGDANGNYNNHGHNKGTSTYKYRLGQVNFTTGSAIALTMPCTGCHAGLATGNPGTRAPHVRGPVGADNQAKYLTRFNLDKQTIPSDDGGSIYGNPLRGTCTYCHQTYEEHVVATAGASDVGCLDCHDEHGEGSGVGSNAFMIPEKSKANGVYNQAIPGYRLKAGLETVSFATPRYRPDGVSNSPNIDFYKGAADTGACDNAECHGKWGASLNDLMTAGGSVNHTGSPRSGGIDCEGCHRHNGDSGGGWRAKDSCDTCHAASGLVHADPNESAISHNTKHRAGSYITDCDVCHPHHGEIPADGSGLHADGTVQFKTKAAGGKLDSTLSYAVGAFPNTDCNSVNGCHDADANEWRAGSLGADACEDCHDAAAKGIREAALKSMDQGWWTSSSPGSATAKHLKHINAAATYVATDCDDCHGANAAAGAHGLHKNGAVDNVVNYVPGNQTCTNACHATAAGDWTSGGALACVECHAGANTAGGGANLPASGLHAVANATRHDAALQSGTCVNCHSAGSPSSAHLNGTLNSSMSATFAFSANVVSYGSAAGCQAAASCHGGGDGGTWRRRWIGVVDAVPGTVGNDTPGQPVCQNCHGDFSGWRWSGADPTTTSHTDPYAGNAGDQMNQHSGCERCHGWGGAAYTRTWKTGNHGNGSIEMNGPDATHGTAAGNQYNDATGGCAFACHGGAFAMNTSSGWAAVYGNYGIGDCGACHGPGGAGPTVVWPAGNAVGRRTAYGSHLGAATAEEANGFLGGIGGAWAGQCNKCHDTHGGSIKVPAPPVSWTDPSGRLTGTNMRTRLGLTYSLESNVAVHLGGTAQGGASEAEFCWACHDANTVSEWGFNTKTTPAGFPVATFTTPDGNQESENHGWTYTTAGHTAKTSDWTQGYWMSQYDAILARRIASVHSTSFDPAGQSSSVAANVDAAGLVNRTSPTLEARAYLRCSNCHDVHDTFGPNGKPYLRGTSIGNPYPPELPPRSSYAYTAGANVSYPTPRGRSTARDKGGYFIDQNSNWPTNNAAMDTLQETAELCTLCHGSNVDTLDFYTGKKLWRAPMVNGHSNAALGGTGANKADLFTGSRYGLGMAMQWNVGSPPYVCGQYGGECDSTYPLSWWMNGCCDGQQVIYNSGWFGGPGGSFTGQGGDFTNWYGTGTIGGANAPGQMAHKFTCSKCHTPHASGLPALLIQNCIDPALGTYTINGATGANLVANNCHRKTSTADGWHVLAPGQ